MTSTVIIYALCEPGTTNARYIGKTTQKDDNTAEQSIIKRIRKHLTNCHIKPHSHVKAWIKSLKAAGRRPDFLVIDKGTDETWQALERYHIASHRKAGFALTNYSDGGEDGHYSAGVRLRVSNNLKGKPKSPETRARMSAAMKGKPGHPGWMKARTHCKNGHEYSADNTYVDARGARWCRTCARAREALFRQRHSNPAVDPRPTCSLCGLFIHRYTLTGMCRRHAAENRGHRKQPS